MRSAFSFLTECQDPSECLDQAIATLIDGELQPTHCWVGTSRRTINQCSVSDIYQTNAFNLCKLFPTQYICRVGYRSHFVAHPRSEYSLKSTPFEYDMDRNRNFLDYIQPQDRTTLFKTPFKLERLCSSRGTQLNTNWSNSVRCAMEHECILNASSSTLCLKELSRISSMNMELLQLLAWWRRENGLSKATFRDMTCVQSKIKARIRSHWKENCYEQRRSWPFHSGPLHLAMCAIRLVRRVLAMQGYNSTSAIRIHIRAMIYNVYCTVPLKRILPSSRKIIHNIYRGLGPWLWDVIGLRRHRTAADLIRNLVNNFCDIHMCLDGTRRMVDAYDIKQHHPLQDYLKCLHVYKLSLRN